MKLAKQFILSVALFLLPFGVLAETITIMSGEYDPYTTSRAKYGGFVNRVVAEAFSRKGITVTFKYLPWNRVKEEGRMGRATAISYYYFTRKNQHDFFFSKPVVVNRIMLFHLKSKKIPAWSKIQDLAAFKFGATLGFSYTDEFWNTVKAGEITVEQVATDMQNLKKILSGRTDIFPMEEKVAWNLINNKLSADKDKLTTHPAPFAVIEGYLIFPKKSPGAKNLLFIFDEGLAEMKADGTYDKYKDDLLVGIY